jgi:16S rRNA (cytidine1402-2'-O)-methyltransferase
MTTPAGGSEGGGGKDTDCVGPACAGTVAGGRAGGVAAGARGADNGAGALHAQRTASATQVIAAVTVCRRLRRHGDAGAFMSMERTGGTAAMPRGEPMIALGRTLYVVATPIGNLRDLSFRALDILSQADLVAAEDTRVTAVLLAHYGVRAPMLSLNEHNERQRSDAVLARLAAGERVALVSDAGTPGISDPGALLVRAVLDAGFDVVPIPGPSAVATALSACGLALSRWMFCGFLPATASARNAALDTLADIPCALVFYEAPHRVRATLAAMAERLGGDRELVIARELTKHFETIARMPLAAATGWITADDDRTRGEFVLIVDAPLPAQHTADEHDALLSLLLAELPLARAVKLAVAITGASRNALYARALTLQAKR